MAEGFLIASPQMRDPNFSKTVVLICKHDESGALGLVINRDGPVSLQDVVSRMNLLGVGDDTEPVPEIEGSTWWGGPVGTGTGFVLWRGAISETEGWNIGDSVAVSPSAERLGQLVESREPFRLCLGYAGWGPGQLDVEISTGSWLYTDMDARIIFDTPMDERYEKALALLGLSAVMVWMRPINE